MSPDPEEPTPFDERIQKRLEALAVHLEIEAQFLQQCLRCEAIGLDDLRQEGADLPHAHVSRLRRIQRICHDLDIDVFAGCIIVELVDRIDELQGGGLKSIR